MQSIQRTTPPVASPALLNTPRRFSETVIRDSSDWQNMTVNSLAKV